MHVTGQRFMSIRHIMAHTLMRHPGKVKKMTKCLQGLALNIQQAEHRRQVWLREAEKMPPKESNKRRNRDGN